MLPGEDDRSLHQPFENDDQKFWEEVTGGQEPEPPRDVLDGAARMKLHEDMIVNSEIVDRVFEEEFATAEDQDIADLAKKLESLGMDPALARDVYERNRRQGRQTVPAAQPFAVLPMKQWEEAKTRLNEEAKRTAKLLLNRTGLRPEGREIPFKLKPGIGQLGAQLLLGRQSPPRSTASVFVSRRIRSSSSNFAAWTTPSWSAAPPMWFRVSPVPRRDAR